MLETLALVGFFLANKRERWQNLHQLMDTEKKT